MTKTEFLGIPAGDITWEGLLNGSAGVVGAFLVAWFAFWLRHRQTHRSALRDAV